MNYDDARSAIEGGGGEGLAAGTFGGQECWFNKASGGTSYSQSPGGVNSATGNTPIVLGLIELVADHRTDDEGARVSDAIAGPNTFKRSVIEDLISDHRAHNSAFPELHASADRMEAYYLADGAPGAHIVYD